VAIARKLIWPLTIGAIGLKRDLSTYAISQKMSAKIEIGYWDIRGLAV
jgi:hypothetical protein